MKEQGNKSLDVRIPCTYNAHHSTKPMSKTQAPKSPKTSKLPLKGHNMFYDPRITALVDLYCERPGSRWRNKSHLGNSLFVKFLRSKRIKVPAEYTIK